MFPQMLVGQHMHAKQIPFNNSRYFIKDYQRVRPKMVLDMWDCGTVQLVETIHFSDFWIRRLFES